MSIIATSGVYAIKNRVTGKYYVGSSTNIEQRWSRHRGELRRGSHNNVKMQEAWDKDGESNFDFVILVECPIDEAVQKERMYIDLFNCETDGYNARGTKDNTERREKLETRLWEEYVGSLLDNNPGDVVCIPLNVVSQQMDSSATKVLHKIGFDREPFLNTWHLHGNIAMTIDVLEDYLVDSADETLWVLFARKDKNHQLAPNWHYIIASNGNTRYRMGVAA